MHRSLLVVCFGYYTNYIPSQHLSKQIYISSSAAHCFMLVPGIKRLRDGQMNVGGIDERRNGMV